MKNPPLRAYKQFRCTLYEGIFTQIYMAEKQQTVGVLALLAQEVGCIKQALY